MKKLLPMFLLTMFLGVFAIGCGSAPPPSPPEAPAGHEAEAEHSASAEHAA